MKGKATLAAFSLVGLAILWRLLGLPVALSRVHGASMQPAFPDGEAFFIAPVSPDCLSRGDVVALSPPNDPDERYLKRVIGLPGDTVQVFSDGVAMLNGALLEEPYAHCEPANWLCGRPSVAVKVKPGTLFVLGDNRPRSFDSRDFGLVPQGRIIGRVTDWLGRPIR